MRTSHFVLFVLAIWSVWEAQSLAAENAEEGFVPIFDGRTLDGWVGVAGNTDSYYIADGILICKAEGRDPIFTEKEYTDFVLRFEFKLEPGGNNGIAIRSNVCRDPHWHGTEIQVLDDTAPKHQGLKPYQFHGSIYGVVPAKRGFLKPVGEWNQEEILCQGRHIRVTLNGTVIVDADLSKVTKPTPDHKDHPALDYAKGHIGLAAHGNGQQVFFRNLRIKEL